VLNLEILGKAPADAAWSCHSNLPGVDECEVMEGEHGVTCQNRVRPGVEDRLHELVMGCTWNVLKAIQALPKVLEPTALPKLSQFDSGHVERFRVAGGDVAVLIKCALV